MGDIRKAILISSGKCNCLVGVGVGIWKNAKKKKKKVGRQLVVWLDGWWEGS